MLTADYADYADEKRPAPAANAAGLRGATAGGREPVIEGACGSRSAAVAPRSVDFVGGGPPHHVCWRPARFHLRNQRNLRFLVLFPGWRERPQAAEERDERLLIGRRERLERVARLLRLASARRADGGRRVLAVRRIASASVPARSSCSHGPVLPTPHSTGVRNRGGDRHRLPVVFQRLEIGGRRIVGVGGSASRRPIA